MDKILLAEKITNILELPSYSKRKFIEDIEMGQWLENNCELSSLVHTHLTLSRTPEQLLERLQQDIIKLETIAKLITITYEKAN